jgi:hypothetical protein
MSNVVEFVSFNLKKGTAVSDFLLVSDKFNSVFLSTQKGYISRKLLLVGDMWADSVLWETMEDALKAFNTADENAVACEYVSFLEEESIKVLHLSVERSY